jgi:DNA repair protein RadD
MVTFNDRIVGSAILAEAINSVMSEQQDAMSNWYRRFLYSDVGLEDELKEIVKSFARGMSESMGWKNTLNPVIPNELIPNLIVESLGVKLLQSGTIRATLARHSISKDDTNGYALANLLGCERAPEKIEGAIIQLQYRPSTKFAYEFCNLLGLPQSFATVSSTDDRPRFEITRAAIPIQPLLDFQKNVYSNLREVIESPNGRGLVVMPTGSGKTRTTVQSVVDSIHEGDIPPHGIVWIADRDELCEQAMETFRKVAEQRCRIPLYLWRYWKGNICDIHESSKGDIVPGIVITSVQTLQRRIKNNDAIAMHILNKSNLFIVDEAHRNLDWIEKMHNQLIMNRNQAVLVGLSATPFRRVDAESGRLATIFSWNAITPFEGGAESPEMVIETLVEMGVLANRQDKTIREFGIKSQDIGDDGQLKICIEIVNELIENNHQSIIVFTPNVKWANLAASILSLQSDDVVAESLSSETPALIRRGIIHSFREKECHVLFNCEILTTGFDAPKTDAVIISRPAMKPHDPLFLQMVGRGLRGPKFGGTKNCTVVHHKW